MIANRGMLKEAVLAQWSAQQLLLGFVGSLVQRLLPKRLQPGQHIVRPKHGISPCLAPERLGARVQDLALTVEELVLQFGRSSRIGDRSFLAKRWIEVLIRLQQAKGHAGTPRLRREC
jgi:hypothetical protein